MLTKLTAFAMFIAGILFFALVWLAETCERAGWIGNRRTK